MSILQARSLTLRFAQEKPLFAAVDFEWNEEDRIALIGPNGAGKTSLLRILNGDLEPDRGTVIRRRGLRHAYFAQSRAATAGESVEDWLALPEMADLERVLRGLGFATADLRSPLHALSSGQRSRAWLARTLVEPADILLLDEPTNHLDAAARIWLERHLIRERRTVLFVSHDEDFLGAVATRIFAIRRGEFHDYPGGHREWQSHAAAREQGQWAAYEAGERQAAALQRAAERREALAAKVAKMPPGGQAARPFYNKKAAKVARTGRLLRERSAPENQAPKPWEEQAFPRLDFAACRRSGDPPVFLHGVSIGYTGEPVIRHLDLALRRGERWAIRGANGSGKTTLFRAIRGELPAAEGRIEIGANVSIGYFAQEAETLDPADTAIGACLRYCADLTWIRTLLACLKLPRELAAVPVGRLSLGERAKAALAQILVSGANLLLLDEPTNHLEIGARTALVQTLVQYPGTMLITSHDEAFLESVATHSLALGTGR